MIGRLIFILLGILALIWLLHWLSSIPPQQRSARLRQAILWVIAVVLIVLALTGRLHWILALLAPLLPLARRLLPLVRYVPLLNHLFKQHKASRRAGSHQAGSGASGQVSHVETRFVRMTLDHDSGEIHGVILDGQYRGQSLASLSESQLTDLYQLYIQQDPESSRLLMAYLDQRFGPGWQEAEQAYQHSTDERPAAMERREALAILGLDDTATKQDIIDAHRRLMQKLHPDRGGSDYLAAKINQAKDMLLGQADQAGRST